MICAVKAALTTALAAAAEANWIPAVKLDVARAVDCKLPASVSTVLRLPEATLPATADVLSVACAIELLESSNSKLMA